MICVNCGKEIDAIALREKQINFDGDAKICIDCITNLCSRKKIIYKDFNDRLVIEDNVFNETRTIVILLNNVVIKEHKKFREIVGLDVLSGGIVKIVDENGKRYGFHTDSEYISVLKINDVIKAPFKIAEDMPYINMWRIVGNYERIGETQLSNLREKYRSTHFFDICVEFDDVLAFAQESSNSFYCLTRFKGCKLKRHGQKLCLKMLEEQVAVDNENKNPTIKEGWTFKGIALLHVSKKNGKSTFVAKHLYSNCQNSERDSISPIVPNIQKNNFDKKEKFEKLHVDEQEYYQIRENVQKKMTEEEIKTIVADLSGQPEIIKDERVRNRMVNNLIKERELTI